MSHLYVLSTLKLIVGVIIIVVILLVFLIVIIIKIK